jgi:hypothetical protein
MLSPGSQPGLAKVHTERYRAAGGFSTEFLCVMPLQRRRGRSPRPLQHSSHPALRQEEHWHRRRRTFHKLHGWAGRRYVLGAHSGGRNRAYRVVPTADQLYDHEET